MANRVKPLSYKYILKGEKDTIKTYILKSYFFLLIKCGLSIYLLTSNNGGIAKVLAFLIKYLNSSSPFNKCTPLPRDKLTGLTIHNAFLYFRKSISKSLISVGIIYVAGTNVYNLGKSFLKARICLYKLSLRPN